MGLKIYNQRPKSEFITGLYLSPVAQTKTAVASIGGGAASAELSYLFLNAVAMPIIVAGGLTVIVFLGVADNIENYMAKRALKNGDVKIKSHRRPKINI